MAKSTKATKNSSTCTSTNRSSKQKNVEKSKDSITSSTNNDSDGFPIQQLLERSNIKLQQHQQQPVVVLLQDKIWVVSNFFTSTECQSWIDYFETKMKVEYISHRSTRFIASRECYRSHKIDLSMGQKLYDRIVNSTLLLQNYLPQFATEEPVMCNPNIRIYKYTKGMSFGQHVDESNTIPGLGKTRFTVLIYLSSCTGGATRFEKNVALFVPVQGSLLLHIHGNDCLLHEADPVESGIKYVLRTDLVYKRLEVN